MLTAIKIQNENKSRYLPVLAWIVWVCLLLLFLFLFDSTECI